MEIIAAKPRCEDVYIKTANNEIKFTIDGNNSGPELTLSDGSIILFPTPISRIALDTSICNSKEIHLSKLDISHDDDINEYTVYRKFRVLTVIEYRYENPIDSSKYYYFYRLII